jgi:tRNA (guanine-N7-)-methyltransferase
MAPKKSSLPRKRFYRARAHSNPLSDSQFPVPLSPDHVDWSQSFPHFFSAPAPASAPASAAAAADSGDGEDAGKGIGISISSDGRGSDPPQVRFADVGCGFGGLLVKLSPMFPDTLMVGMELRDKVCEYVKERIEALRRESHGGTGGFRNIAVVRTNAMKYLHNYFRKGQLHKMFFLFPDPHFKERNHRRRVISVALLAEYAYAMAVGGVLYTITDVEELGLWIRSCLDAHPLFQEVPWEEQEADPVAKLLETATEEGQKVERNGGDTFRAVYRRVAMAPSS